MQPTPAMHAYIAPVIDRTPVDAPILRQVPLPYLGKVWPDISSWVAGVVERSDGRWSIEIIAKQLLNGTWQLWVVWDGENVAAVIATELYSEATGLPLARVVFTTGTGAAKWSHLIADIEDWARGQGARKLEMMARKGWAKHLQSYKMTHVLLEKDLTDGQ